LGADSRKPEFLLYSGICVTGLGVFCLQTADNQISYDDHLLYKPDPTWTPDTNMKCVSWYNLIFWNLSEKSPFYYVLINKEIRTD
jgi:hypothetical protein